MSHLRQVLERYRRVNLTLKGSKCQFGRKTVKFLGHIVSETGISMDPEKVQAIRDFAEPKTRKELRAFLGMVGWYHNFVRRFADLAEPLYALTSPKRRFSWSPKAAKAFQNMKDAMIEDLVLAHPIFDKPFIVRTDAAKVGVGATLSQINDDGEEKVICFASKSLSHAQQNYSTPEQECYAIVFALEKFRIYIANGPRLSNLPTNHEKHQFTPYAMGMEDPRVVALYTAYYGS